ncbi:MAG: hypothetical protein ABI968_12820 [Acidobacteriota bacterium]
MSCPILPFTQSKGPEEKHQGRPAIRLDEDVVRGHPGVQVRADSGAVGEGLIAAAGGCSGTNVPVGSGTDEDGQILPNH